MLLIVSGQPFSAYPIGRRAAFAESSGARAQLRPGIAVGLLIAGFLTAGFLPSRLSARQQGDLPRIEVPTLDVGALQLQSLRKAQLERAPAIVAFHDFVFSDRLPESGIMFRHRAVADATSSYKMVHYDHGNAIAVADVDGDQKLDIYFVNQVGANELWRNVGGGRFESLNAKTPAIALADRICVAASFADVDNDGDADLFVTSVRGGNALLINDGKGHFEDRTASSGLAYSGHSSGAVFFDFDRDGRLDLFVANVGRYTEDRQHPDGSWIGLEDAFSGHRFPERTEKSLLYRGLGDGRFKEVSAEVGLVDTSWAGDASAADLNEDGYPDLYVLSMQGDDHYYENQGGKRFVEKTAELFPKTPWGAMGLKFFDWDNDGDEDLILTDMHSDMSFEVGPQAEHHKSLMTWSEEHLQGGDNNIFGNAFFENPGTAAAGKAFAEISDRVQAEQFWPWGLSVGDLNADGWQDVLITASMNFPFRYGFNTALLNEEGKQFAHSEFILGIEPRRDGRTKQTWFEIDCPPPADTAPPALPAVGEMLKQCARSRGRHAVMGSLGSRTSAIFDLDGDGDVDIVTGEFNGPPQVLISNLAERTAVHWLEVVLHGSASNRDGLGARVSVVAAGSRWTQWNDGKSGYLAQSRTPLYFGLGAQASVERIEVLWPSGKQQTVSEGLALGRRVELTEP